MRPLWVGPASDAWIDISPDGRFIVVDRPGDDGDTDLAIIDVATGQVQPLLTGPASDSNASWTPDGSAIVYMSNSAGVRGLHMVRVAAGAVDGAPALLHEFPRGMVTKIGFTSDGALFLERLTHWYNTFRARIDLAAGVVSPPRRLDPRTTTEETPGVSVNPLDGRIAYMAGGLGALTAPTRVVILSADGRRQERELPVAGRTHRKSRVQWSPDGTRVAVSANVGARNVIEVLDVEQGTVAHVIDAAGGWDHKWDPGGAAIYYAVGSEIRAYDLQLGTSTTFYRSPIRLVDTATFDVSPVDGTLLLPAPGAIVIARAGEAPAFRIVPGLIASLAWTRDGSRILVSRIDRTQPSPRSRCWMPARVPRFPWPSTPSR
jgi:dipeptidyl aminopeptidase/acylaminoacyl peptidase